VDKTKGAQINSIKTHCVIKNYFIKEEKSAGKTQSIIKNWKWRREKLLASYILH